MYIIITAGLFLFLKFILTSPSLKIILGINKIKANNKKNIGIISHVDIDITTSEKSTNNRMSIPKGK
ncbi:hypothetical protein GCM10027043_50440 [Ferruginibacter profundus]